MFKMQNLNVVRMVETVEQKSQLESQGFEEVAEVEPEYESYTLIGLKQMAKEKNIEGYYTMKKDDLIEKLKSLNDENKNDESTESGTGEQ